MEGAGPISSREAHAVNVIQTIRKQKIEILKVGLTDKPQPHGVAIAK